MQRPEQEIQRACLSYLALSYPQGFVFHVPNGHFRDIRTAVRLKKDGVRRGVSDLIVIRPKGKTAWLEIKAPKGVLSSDQREFLGFLYNNSHEGHMIRDVLELSPIIEKWKNQDKLL